MQERERERVREGDGWGAKNLTSNKQNTNFVLSNSQKKLENRVVCGIYLIYYRKLNTVIAHNFPILTILFSVIAL